VVALVSAQLTRTLALDQHGLGDPDQCLARFEAMLGRANERIARDGASGESALRCHGGDTEAM